MTLEGFFWFVQRLFSFCFHFHLLLEQVYEITKSYNFLILCNKFNNGNIALLAVLQTRGTYVVSEYFVSCLSSVIVNSN